MVDFDFDFVEAQKHHIQMVQDDGGPGRAAALYSHFWMLRRVQRGYACFDAYARTGSGDRQKV